ncbi:MAG: radical SAM protein [Chloroflexota bacterium]
MAVKTLSETGIEDLKSPLFFAWHVTNRCNLNCIHCLWESGPHSIWPDELTTEEAIGICHQIIEQQIPYAALSGGEPLLWPGFWPVLELLRANGIDVKIETNGQLVDQKAAERLARLNLRSVQISIDGITQETYGKMRSGAKLERSLQAIKHLVAAGAVTEIVYVPVKFNIQEAEQVIDWAAEQGVRAFYTGKTMYIGRAVKNWDQIGLSDEEADDLNKRIEAKAVQYRDKMTILYYPYSIIEELVYRVDNPAASLLMMCNGKVKLLGSVPYVCGDVRKHSLDEIWERYKEGWKQPEVAEYVRAVAKNPTLLVQALDLIEQKL